MNTEQGKYDSTADTLLHIERVNELLLMFAQELIERAWHHDNSKLSEPEKSAFDRESPLLKTLVYGSDEYKASTARLGEALKHHHANNSHHPEHYPNGIDGMNLLDLVEMFFDWKAAGERNAGGNIFKSIEYCKGRYNISDQLAAILTNTAINYFGDNNQPQ